MLNDKGEGVAGVKIVINGADGGVTSADGRYSIDKVRLSIRSLHSVLVIRQQSVVTKKRAFFMLTEPRRLPCFHNIRRSLLWCLLGTHMVLGTILSLPAVVPPTRRFHVGLIVKYALPSLKVFHFFKGALDSFLRNSVSSLTTIGALASATSKSNFQIHLSCICSKSSYFTSLSEG